MRNGFNMIELVFVLVMVGILSAVAIPRFSVGRDDACYAKLRANLSETETVLSREYTKRFLKGQAMSQAELLTYLKKVESGNSEGCKLTVQNVNSIRADIGPRNVILNVAADATTKMPTITCPLTAPTCQKLMGRTNSN